LLQAPASAIPLVRSIGTTTHLPSTTYKTRALTMAATNEKTKPQQKPTLGRVLVIGGCGFLGHHVVRLLVENWDCSAVSVLDLRCGRNRRPDSDGVEYIEADITDEPKLVDIMKRLRPDVVVHTASPLATGTNVSNELFRRVNVDGTRSVVAACQQTGVKALVFTSSASIMSDNRSDLINVNETWPVIRGAAQAEYYSETKVTQHPPSRSLYTPPIFLYTCCSSGLVPKSVHLLTNASPLSLARPKPSPSSWPPTGRRASRC
jgi:hypothetical protein